MDIQLNNQKKCLKGSKRTLSKNFNTRVSRINHSSTVEAKDAVHVIKKPVPEYGAEASQKTNNPSGFDPYSPDFIVTDSKFDAENISTTLHIPTCYPNYHNYEWMRDPRVVRPDGKHLIPFCYKDMSVDNELLFFVDKNSVPLMNLDIDKTGKLAGMCGNGFNKGPTTEALEFGEKNNIRTIQATTGIEGGNCRIYPNRVGEPSAIMGIHTLWLTYLALQEQGFIKPKTTESKRKNFDNYLLSNTAKDKEDFLEACRIVIYDKQRKLGETKINSEDSEIVKTVKNRSISKSLPGEVQNASINPYLLSNSELQQAYSIKEAIVFTKEQISKELGIKLENMTFIPQTQFHIDMQMFVSPKGTVFVNDDELIKNNVCNISKKNIFQNDNEILKAYYEFAKNESKQKRFVTKNIEEKLENNGNKVIRIPGAYGGFNDNCTKPLNFFNGFFVKEQEKYVYITTGGRENDPLNEYLEKQFRKAVLSAAPEVSDVRFINTSKCEDYLHEGGGYNCRTFQGFGEIPKSLEIVPGKL